MGARKLLRRAKQIWQLGPHLDDFYEVFKERGGAKLSATERELLESALAFQQVVADDITVPRAGIVAVPEKAGLGEVMDIFAKSAHSRMPVIGKNLDEVKGFVLLKDVVMKSMELKGREKEFALGEITRPLPVVPETMSATSLLQVMKRAEVTMVLVVDEFGGTSGIACMRDVLAELVGDVGDAGGDAGSRVLALGGGKFYARGNVLLEEFDGIAGTNLASQFGGSVETIAGALMQAALQMPQKGERVKLTPQVEAMVTVTNGRRIGAVEVRVAG